MTLRLSVAEIDRLGWNEKDLQENTVSMARTYGWMAVHFGGDIKGHAYYDSAGFPDLLLVHAERSLVWFRELKSDVGKLTAKQQRWADRLNAEGLNYDLWRPADWPDIVAALSFGRGRVAGGSNR